MTVITTRMKFLILVCLLVSLTLSACKENEESHEEEHIENELQNISYAFENPKTNQQFNLIHVYLLYENYFTTVKEQPDESISKLYKQEVITPINEVCFKEAEYSDVKANFEKVPKRSEFDRVQKQIEKMNSDQLNEVFEESLIQSSDILPTDKETTVCIFPGDKHFPSDMGTIGAGEIVVYYTGFRRDFKAGMAHEYHHSVWLERHSSEKDLRTGLDRLTMEGQAVMFETLVYPDLNSMYALLDESFNKEHWSKTEPYLNRIDGLEIQDIITGGSNGIPTSYGYSEGYKIIRSYLDLHPDMTVEEWTSKDPKEIFEEVNYIDNYR